MTRPVVGVVDAVAVRRFLERLFESAPVDSLIELRVRRSGGMRQSFHRAAAIADVVDEVASCAASTDVFVGVVPRARRGGGRRDLVGDASVLWVDCDTPMTVAALETFRPAPSLLVASGGRGRRHAYWLLRKPAAIKDIEQANRALATALSADLKSSDPARILRPAGSLWHKSSPAAAVELLHVDDDVRHEAGEVIGGLVDVPTVSADARPQRRIEAAGDPLLTIAPAEYVVRLTGAVIARGGKARCPFHTTIERRACMSSQSPSGAGTALAVALEATSTISPQRCGISPRGARTSQLSESSSKRICSDSTRTGHSRLTG